MFCWRLDNRGPVRGGGVERRAAWRCGLRACVTSSRRQSLRCRVRVRACELCASTGVFLCDTFYSIFIIGMQFSLFYNNSTKQKKFENKSMAIIELIYIFNKGAICIVTGFKRNKSLQFRIIYKSTILIFIIILCLENNPKSSR